MAGRKKGVNKLLDNFIKRWYYHHNNIRKALTETSSLPESIQREQHLVEAAYAERRRKPFQSCNAQSQ